MSEMLNDLRLAAFARLGTMANLRWFTPNQTFWTLLEPYKDKKLVDCGCGIGALTTEGRQLGFNMTGIDLVKRRGQAKHVLPLDACAYPFDADTWPLICRPDHSGWSYDCIARALTRGASALYVGKWENLDNDLGELQQDVIFSFREVGMEGEMMCVIRRINT